MSNLFLSVLVWSRFTVCDGGFFPPLSSPQSKRRFERDCKEADRAQQYFERMDADINVTKADVEKVLFISASSPTSRAARVLTLPPSTSHTLSCVAAFSYCKLQLFGIVAKQPMYCQLH